MNFETQTHSGIHIVHLHGELKGEEAAEFVEGMTNLFAGPGTRIVIDLADVPFMNSDGLSQLVRVNAQANVQEGRIVLANLSPFVAGVLNTTRLDRFFELADTLDAALTRLQ